MSEKYTNKPAGGIEERLWDFIDGNSSVGERSTIEQLLESNNEWKSKYQELLAVHQLMQSAELEAPSMRFSKNVMEEIARLQIAPATRTYINKKLIWGLGLFFILLFVGFVVYGFGQINWSDKSSSSTIAENLGKIKINNFFNNTWVNVFMMINVVLGLFLLDNYLTNKKKKFTKS
jgi:hypothetical protein